MAILLRGLDKILFQGGSVGGRGHRSLSGWVGQGRAILGMWGQLAGGQEDSYPGETRLKWTRYFHGTRARGSGGARGRRRRNAPVGTGQSSLTDIPTALLPMVALVGRPNVGKSALFNRLAKKRLSIVHNTPLGHVTRDYQEGRAKLGDVEFLAVDTSGLEPVMMGENDDLIRQVASPSGTESIHMRATALTADILRQSDVVLFLLDGKEGVTGVDMDLCRWFRRMSSALSGALSERDGADGRARSFVSKIVPVVNKCEGRHENGWDLSSEVVRMGLNSGEYVGVSAETGEGMADLYRVLQGRLDGVLRDRAASVLILGGKVEEAGEEAGEEDGCGGKNADNTYHVPRKHIRFPKVAIMGLTNVGKSTLLNRLVGHERCITGPEPGLTRDAITVELKGDTGETVMELVDTAGWIRKTRLKAHDDSDGAVAEMTMREGKTVLRFVHIVLLVVDCARVLEKLEAYKGSTRDSVLSHAEAALAADAVRQGRALVVGLNKVDMCGSVTLNGIVQSESVLESRAVEAIRESLKQATPELGDAAMVLPLSAIDGAGVDKIVPSIQKVYDTWNARIPTAKLNAWLKELKVQKAHVGGGNSVRRIKYLSQVKSRPPTFVAFVSGKTKLGDSVERFVANSLRDEFDMAGVPLRVVQRNSA